MTLDIASSIGGINEGILETVVYESATARETADHIGNRVKGLLNKPIVGKTIRNSVAVYLAKFEDQLQEEGMTEHVDIVMGEAWKLIASVDSVKEIRLDEISVKGDPRVERLVKNIIEKLQRLNPLEKKFFEMFKVKFIGRLKKAKLTNDQAGIVAAMVWDARGIILNG